MCNDCCIMREYAKTVQIPPKDWLVLAIIDRGPGNYYRYQVSGENLNYPPDHRDRHFSWFVRDLADPRYDLSQAPRGNI